MHPLQHRRLLIALAATLIVVGPGVVVASAQQPAPPVRPQEIVRGPEMGADRVARQEHGRSLSDAVRRVQRETGGRILGAERVPYDGRDINRVKYMDDRGRVRYMDDPQPSRSGPRGPRAELPPRGDNS
ncbi:MAG: PepSY domain-containing protein [Stenotrophomonas sp.]|uniref:PepSY domain-containing protein n=1 Tax=Stenotrophomonas sp. TaxID=69392 RepID=UPI003D6D6B5B